MTISIEVPEGEDALTELVLFRDRVYAGWDAVWPTIVPLELGFLTGASPAATGRRTRPFVARQGGEIVARVVAVVDQRYIEHWDEPLGHIVMFEALPEALGAVRVLMDEAGGWLRSEGMRAGRTGFGPMDFPYVLDAHDTLPPSFLRTNPPYYHRFLKEAGFESEKGWVDYKISVTPELVSRWEGSVEAAARSGFEIIPFRDLPEDRRLEDYVATWNEAFRAHWGASPITEADMADLFAVLGPLGLFDTSVIAYRDSEPVGVVFVAPESTSMVKLGPGRELRPDEKLNFLGIGVRESARGKGVNMAMAGYAYLELVRRGATHLSYTLVLDDNWPSRRTAEKLGAHVCANYVVYRRNFDRR